LFISHALSGVWLISTGTSPLSAIEPIQIRVGIAAFLTFPHHVSPA
jgi:hypothetical protein